MNTYGKALTSEDHKFMKRYNATMEYLRNTYSAKSLATIKIACVDKEVELQWP